MGTPYKLMKSNNLDKFVCNFVLGICTWLPGVKLLRYKAHLKDVIPWRPDVTSRQPFLISVVEEEHIIFTSIVDGNNACTTPPDNLKKDDTTQGFFNF